MKARFLLRSLTRLGLKHIGNHGMFGKLWTFLHGERKSLGCVWKWWTSNKHHFSKLSIIHFLFHFHQFVLPFLFCFGFSLPHYLWKEVILLSPHFQAQIINFKTEVKLKSSVLNGRGSKDELGKRYSRNTTPAPSWTQNMITLYFCVFWRKQHFNISNIFHSLLPSDSTKPSRAFFWYSNPLIYDEFSLSLSPVHEVMSSSYFIQM